jgi:hypothetical protein
MVMDLTAQEQTLLAELLSAAHKEMIHELNHTDTREYKEILKQRLLVLEGIYARVSPSESAAPR